MSISTGSGIANAVKVRTFEEEDESAVLEVLQTAFGHWPGEIAGLEPGQYFQWKHRNCPFGPSVLLVAEADGAIIGCQGYMPWQLRSAGQTLLTIRRVDLAVHPDYWRLGVSMAIRAAARYPPEAAFTWTNANKQSRRGTRKHGLSTVRWVPSYAQLRRPLH